MTKTGVIRSFTVPGGRKLVSVQPAALRIAINATKKPKPKQPNTPTVMTRPHASGD